MAKLLFAAALLGALLVAGCGEKAPESSLKSNLSKPGAPSGGPAPEAPAPGSNGAGAKLGKTD